MSYKNPTIPILSVKGIDAKIQLIQEKMSFAWLENAYGIADKLVDKDEKVIPGVYESDTIDPIILTPSDLHSAFCFWVAGDSEIEDEPGMITPIHTYPVSCIFYIDVKRVATDYKITGSKIREDIHNFFRTLHFNGQLTSTGSTEDYAEIYAEFDVEDIDSMWTEYPKWAIRVNFDLSFRYSCYTTNEY